jgi:aspartate kinase
MSLIVQKFGGTSVANTDRIKEVAKIVLLEIKNNNKVIVVVSAMSGVTNALISTCGALSDLATSEQMREYDAVLSSGETVTSALLALELQNHGQKSMSMQAWQIPISTNNNFSDALVCKIDKTRLELLLKENIVPVIAGFQGMTTDGRITTLGKGGSDTSAALITAAIGADRCDIYTDVEGVYSADPRVVHDTKKIDIMSHEEMMELSSAGAKVLHPRAALAALRYNFDLRVLSSFSELSDAIPASNISSGTLITSKITKMENRKITAITSNKNLLAIEIEHAGINLQDIISHFLDSSLKIEQMQRDTEGSTSFIANLIDKNKFKLLLSDLKNKKIIANFTLATNISTVTIIGYGLKNDINLFWKIIDILENEGIRVKSTNSTEITISILLNDEDTEKTIKILHNFMDIS